MSDGDQSAVKMDMVAWVGGFKQGKPQSDNLNEYGSGDHRLKM